MREKTTKGIIYFTDLNNIQYNISEIEYIIREDESYEYIFKPVYSVIELIDSKSFQGIPGLSLEKKKERYIRKNRVPTFISERTPGPGREDIWELIDEVGMDYINRLEWLIKTKTSITADKLNVKEDKRTRMNGSVLDPLLNENYILDNFDQLHKKNNELIKIILKIICSGANIQIGDFLINNSNRKANYEIFNLLYSRIYQKRRDNQISGVQEAKKENVYKGRKRIKIDPFKFEEVVKAIDYNKMSIKEAMEMLGISRSTLYRRIREFRKENHI